MQGSPKNLNRGGKPKSNGSPAARPPSNYFQQSLVAFGNEKYEEALRLIDLDFKENTQTPKNCTLRGNVLQSMNLDEDAMVWYQKALKLDSRFGVAYNNLGYSLQRMERYEEAIEAYDRAIAIHTDYADTFNNKGLALKALGRNEEALQCFNTAIETGKQKNRENPVAYTNKGNILQTQGKHDEAIECYTSSIRIDPNIAVTHNNMGYSLNCLNYVSEAITEYKKAIELNSSFALAYSNLGFAYERKQKYDAAIKCYASAISIDPTLVSANFNFGHALQMQGQLLRAVERYESALALRPTFAEADFNRGSALFDLGRYQDSFVCFSQACKNVATFSAALLPRSSSRHQIPKKPSSEELSKDMAPERAMSWIAEGKCLQQESSDTYALACFDKAIASAEAWRDKHQESSKGEAGSQLKVMVAISAVARSHKAQLLSHQGNFSMALEEIDKAMELAPEIIKTGDQHNLSGLLDGYQRCILPKYDTKQLYLLKAHCLRMDHNLKGAIQCFSDVVRLDASCEEAYLAIGNIMIGIGEPTVALKAYSKLLLINGESLFAWNNQGVCFERMNKYTEALHSLSEALAKQPSSELVIHNLAICHFHVNQSKDGLRLLNEALADNPHAVSLLYVLGNYHSQMGNYDQAIEVYDKALANDPSHTECLINKGNALSLKGSLDDALLCYEKASVTSDKSVEATLWYNHGTTLAEANQHERAVDSFDKCISLGDNSFQVLVNKGISLFHLKRWDEAISTYTKAVEIRGDDDGVVECLAETLAKAGRPEEALQAYQKLTKRDASNLVAEGLLFDKIMCDHLKARACYDKALAIDERCASRVHMLNGDSYFTEIRFEDAVQEYQAVLSHDKSNIHAYENIVDCYIQLHRFDEAISTYQRLEKLFPNRDNSAKMATCYLEEAKMLFRMGNLDKALETIDMAIEKCSKLPEAFQCKARILAITNRHNEAITSLDKAISLDESRPAHPGRLLLHFDRAIMLVEKGALSKSIADIDKCEICCNIESANSTGHVSRFSSRHTKFLRRLSILLQRSRESSSTKEFIQSIKPALLESLKAARPLFEEVKHPRPGELESLKGLTDEVNKLLNQLTSKLDLTKEDFAVAYLAKAEELKKVGDFTQALHFLGKATESSSTNVKAYILSAECHNELKSPSSALSKIEQALEIDGDNLEAHIFRAKLLVDDGRHSEAIKSYLAASMLKPNDPDICNRTGNCFLDLKDYEQACQWFENSVELAPDNVVARTNLGKAFNFRRMYFEAVKCFDAALDSEPTYVRALLHRGSSFLLLDQPKKALESFKEALDLEFNSSKATCYTGLALTLLGRHQESFAYYEKAVELNSEEYFYHLGHGVAAWHLGLYKQAFDCFELANTKWVFSDSNYSRMEKQLMDEMYVLAKYKVDFTKPIPEEELKLSKKILVQAEMALCDEFTPVSDESVGLLKEVYTRLHELACRIRLRTNSSIKMPEGYASKATRTATLQNALNYQREGKDEEALSAYDELIGKNPEDPMSYSLKGSALQKRGEYEAAIECYSKANSMDQSNALNFNNLGVCLFKLGRNEAAFAAYETAISLSKGYAFIYNNFGNVLQALEEVEGAILAYRDAVTIDSQYKTGYLNLAGLLKKHKRHSEALQCLRAANKAIPGDFAILMAAGNSALKLRLRKEAVEFFTEACGLQPTNEVVQKKLALAKHKLNKDQNVE